MVLHVRTGWRLRQDSVHFIGHSNGRSRKRSLVVGFFSLCIRRAVTTRRRCDCESQNFPKLIEGSYRYGAIAFCKLINRLQSLLQTNTRQYRIYFRPHYHLVRFHDCHRWFQIRACPFSLLKRLDMTYKKFLLVEFRGCHYLINFNILPMGL